ncbi:MAG: hypothetical protein F6K23_39925 [Okeania sp. SIO2C9]|uniref:hypothetical protein n=1 Tax=Okeania sp. SIO2C9 TaxID=2607791 RepID=UPI0013BFA2C0|nr:hypothetical protein [Okeania sp. SIO2C9]NEQ78623.1 hypothetical protein [Okeania sp. SIO2C9]
MLYYRYQGYSDVAFENDPEDFKPPYLLVGKTDREVLESRYLRLRKISYGVISRTGKEEKQWFDYA